MGIIRLIAERPDCWLDLQGGCPLRQLDLDIGEDVGSDD